MLRLNHRQRLVLANNVPDMANLVAAAIVVGFAIGEPAASTSLLAVAIVFWVGALLGAVMISRGTS